MVRDYIGSKRIVLIGHSLGGSIATSLCQSGALSTKVVAVIVVDLVEGPAVASLSMMEDILKSWPKHFTSAEDAIYWSNSVGRPYSQSSARISVPPLLKLDKPALADPITGLDMDERYSFAWRTDLSLFQSFWSDWFTGFDNAFLSLQVPHLLLLSSLEVMDAALTVAHMQGKLELECIGCPGVGHFVHEDFPDETVAIWVKFFLSHGLMSREDIETLWKISLSSLLPRRMGMPVRSAHHGSPG